MRLRDMISAALLPAFAQESRWLQVGFDDITRPNVGRIKAIAAPLTLESIAALNDAELEALYRQYGIAEYYPDLTRETRNLMLYWATRLYRYFGTPKAIEILCNYIFDNNPISVVIHDNMAFDESGNLIDPNLIDIFDVEVLPGDEYIAQDATKRILDNIIRFSRNSQALRNIYYTLPDNDLNVRSCIGLPNDNVGCVILCENNDTCVVASPPDYYIITNAGEVLKNFDIRIEHINPIINTIGFNGITHVTAQINTVGGGIEHWIKYWIFVEVYQPQQLSFNPQYTFSQISQPNLQHFKAEYTFSGIQQPVLEYMNIEE